MSAKAKNIKSVFVCSNCDAQFPKWSGRCLECGSWGTLNEDIVEKKSALSLDLIEKIGTAEVIDFKDIKAESLQRLKTGLAELDRVLGGGLVPGSLILLSGEPGIGKSTLIAQVAAAKRSELNTLYISGEESALQVKGRLERLNLDLSKLKFVADTKVEKIIATAKKLKPDLLIVDSIQTIYSSQMMSEMGSISQIRAVTAQFLELAKASDIAVCLVGHITKDGQVAGPKSLEHMVDTVLSLETENNYNYSLLRASKNRFGSINELGVFEMTSSGFQEIKNPSLVFIDNNLNNLEGGKGKDSPQLVGSVRGCIMEGSRPFIVDLQALVYKTVFGYPQRKTSGFDLNRLQVLSAVISRRTKVNLLAQDIILNIAGGLKVSDPALDLAAVTAIISAYLNKAIPQDTIALGEVSLSGEIRGVARLEDSLKEASRLGFKKAIVPDLKYRKNYLELEKIKDLNDLLKKFA